MEDQKDILTDDSIVISGISGTYPQSRNVKDLEDILYNKINPISKADNVWKRTVPEISEYVGQIPELDEFDAQFCKIHNHLAKCVDPMTRKLLEHSYQALYDAGINPWALKSRKVGVYVGVGISEAERSLYSKLKKGFGLQGTLKTMNANRVSYYLGLVGPSLTYDQMCCSSTVALEQAFQAMLRGDIDGALVGGCNICIKSQVAIVYERAIGLSKDNKSRSFDENANGYVRSDGISFIFLQKAKDAKRVYAELCNVKTDIVSHELSPYYAKCNPEKVKTFLKDFYESVNVNPTNVQYVEAFGCANKDIDKIELEIIDEVFNVNRKGPLAVGSVISNIGFTGPTSGLVSIMKVLIGYHKGLIASNLHCENPKEDVEALSEGRIQILRDHHIFKRNSYIAVNNMSITGCFGHVLLKEHYKPKNSSQYLSNIPYLVVLSGRQEDSVSTVIDNLKCRPIDPEEIALLHSIHSKGIPGHLARGYVVLDKTKQNNDETTEILANRVSTYEDVTKQLWFVYSGMGSQWTGMGRDLMRIPIFATTIHRCQKVLNPTGIDLVDIIMSKEKSDKETIYSFVGICAMQIALTNILKEIGIIPNKIIGHSLGELGCAYADGCMSLEEVMLVTYIRGKLSLESNLIRGSMAAVGLGYKEISKLVPPEIDVACHNGPDSSTISGPEDGMKDFVRTLEAKNIFVKAVNTYNIAYHSRYVAKTGPRFLSELKKIIKEPKLRSDKWISTSVSQDKWNEQWARYSSAEYHAKNFLGPVFFEEAMRFIPDNAVVLEIAPHGLLQAILRRSLSPDCTILSLAQRNHENNVRLLLESVGRLYSEGYNTNLQAIYPKVEFPVSSNTNYLSHLVCWYHEDKCIVPGDEDDTRTKSSCTSKLGILAKVRRYFTPEQLLTLYQAQVRSCMEYCSHLLDGSAKYHLEMLDSIEKRAKRLIGNDALCYRKLQSLEHRRKVASLSVFYRLHHGKNMFPFAAALVAVWDTFAMILEVPKKELSVQFNEVQLFNQPVLQDNKLLRLTVSILKSCGTFEVITEDTKVVTGTIYANRVSNQSNTILKFYGSKDLNYYHETKLNNIYEIFKQKGYSYSKDFQVISQTDQHFTEAEIIWKDNWTTFIEGILQLNTLKHDHDGVSLPVFIRELCINVKTHSHEIVRCNRKLNLCIDDMYGYTTCGGTVMIDVKFRDYPKPHPNKSIHDDVKIKLDGNKRDKKHYMLRCANYGDIESLYWQEYFPKMITRNEVLVNINYASINKQDVKLANGGLPFDTNNTTLGMDFSGVTHSGERVMGIIPNGALCTQLSTNPDLLWPVPKHWTLEDAATIPFPYTQAIYYLFIKGKMRREMTILVHGGSGALGQAVISIALAHNCEVFTTVSDVQKKQFLLKLYLDLKEQNIVYSRNDKFADVVLSITAGKGCDIVIGNVPTDRRNATAKCCTRKLIIPIQNLKEENYDLELFHMFKLKGYIFADVSSIFMKDYPEDLKTIRQYMVEGISAGWVRPMSRVTFATVETPRAFRLVAASKHRGRVLIQLNGDTLQSLIPETVRTQAENTEGNTKADMKFNKEFKTLKDGIAYIDYNDLMGSLDLIPLRTLVSNEKLDEEFYSNKAYVCIVPGVEGHYSRFKDVAKRLKLPAVVLQPELGNITIQRQANLLSKVLLNKVGLKKEFYLLGYEYGVFIALELAAILEDQGFKGTVFCIGDPETIKSIFKDYVQQFYTDKGLQEDLILHICSLLSNTAVPLVKKVLKLCDSWKQRVDTTVQVLRKHLPLPVQYMTEVIESVNARILDASQFDTETIKSLKSKVIFLHTETEVNVKESELQRYSQEPIISCQLKIPLSEATHDLRCSSIINRYLSKDILKQFESKNICESYTEDKSFMNTVIE